jgi:hypothetical protein
MDRPIELVKQVDKTGCAIACGAMVTGKSYEQVKKDMQQIYRAGTTDVGMFAYLYEEGFFVRKLEKYNLIRAECRYWPPKPFAPLHWCQVQVDIDHLNSHAVIMDKYGKVFDPMGNVYDNFDSYAKVYWVAGLW